MKQILTIARLTMRLSFRRGGAWSLLILTAMVSLFMFWVSQSNGELLNELEIRIRFSLYFSLALLSLALLWLACLSMRGDLEAKRIHMLTSFPVRRLNIFLGKWLGLFAIGIIGLTAIMASIGLASWLLMMNWEKKEELQSVKAYYQEVKGIAKPIIPDVDVLAREKLEMLRMQGKYPMAKLESEWLKEERKALLDRQQLVKRGAEKNWAFEMGDLPRKGEYITLVGRFYARKNEPVRGVWHINAKGADGNYYRRTAGIGTSLRPNQTHKIRFPIDLVPENGEISVTFVNKNDQDVLFYNDSGLRIEYVSSNLFSNIMSFYGAIAAHLSVVVAMGLTISTAFTMSVASFVSMILYLLSLASGFFRRFLLENRFDHDLGSFTTGFIKTGLFITTGMEQPAVVESLAKSIQISSRNLGMAVTRDTGQLLLMPLNVFNESGAWSTWMHNQGYGLLIGFIVYFMLVAGLGMWLFVRKELDRVH